MVKLEGPNTMRFRDFVIIGDSVPYFEKKWLFLSDVFWCWIVILHCVIWVLCVGTALKSDLC